MIYIFVALYCEAKPFIEEFNLKRDNDFKKIQVFTGDTCILAVTGAGQMQAAIAVSMVCTKCNANQDDLMLNIGTCAGDAESIGNVMYINKITEECSGKTFYPDIIYAHDFEEAELVTSVSVVDRDRINTSAIQHEECLVKGIDSGKVSKAQYFANDTESEKLLCKEYLVNDNEVENIVSGIAISNRVLYDMEGAGIYQAGANFFKQQNMVFLKIVSDAGVDTKNDINTDIKTDTKINIDTDIRINIGIRNDIDTRTNTDIGNDADTKNNTSIKTNAETDKETKTNTESENNKKNQLTPDMLTEVINKNKAQIISYIQMTQDSIKNLDSHLKIDEEYVDKLSEDMCCSVNMKNQLRQYIVYCYLENNDYKQIIDRYYKEDLLPCKNRKEGKIELENIKRELIQ